MFTVSHAPTCCYAASERDRRDDGYVVVVTVRMDRHADVLIRRARCAAAACVSMKVSFELHAASLIPNVVLCEEGIGERALAEAPREASEETEEGA